MKTSLTSIELNTIVKELQILIGGKIDQIYHPEKKELILQMHVTSLGKKIVKIITGKLIYLTGKDSTYDEPSSFCMYLRKNLSGARIKAIKQLTPERIVEIDLERADELFKLIIELFGNGNIILLNKEDKILSMLEQHVFKDRTIKKDEQYIYPKKEIDFFNLDLDALIKILRRSDKESVVTSLAIDLGMGGAYAEETLIRAAIDKNKIPSELNDKEIKYIFEHINKIISEKKPSIVEALDVVPIDLEKYKNREKTYFETYNEALNKYLTDFKPKEKSKHEKDIEKLNKIISTQEAKIKELDIAEAEERKKAETIYNNYQLISDILAELKKAREKYSLIEMKDKLKGHKVIKEFDTKEKKIVVEI